MNNGDNNNNNNHQHHTCDAVEIMMDVKDDKDKKVLLYFHRFYQYHFKPLAELIEDHLKESKDKFDRIDKHINKEDQLEKKINQVYYLFWALGVLGSIILFFIGVSDGGLLAKAGASVSGIK